MESCGGLSIRRSAGWQQPVAQTLVSAASQGRPPHRSTLLLPERLDRIDARCAAGGNPRSGECRANQDRRSARQRPRVLRRHVEQHALEQADGKQRSDRAQPDAGRGPKARLVPTPAGRSRRAWRPAPCARRSPACAAPPGTRSRRRVRWPPAAVPCRANKPSSRALKRGRSASLPNGWSMVSMLTGSVGSSAATSARTHRAMRLRIQRAAENCGRGAPSRSSGECLRTT